MDFLKKIQDFIMPPVDVKDENMKKAGAAAEGTGTKSVVTMRRVSNGSPVVEYTGVMPTQSFTTAREKNTSRPKLTVHTTNVVPMKMRICVPHNFDDVAKIADSYKSGSSVVVNYEKVEMEDQCRICDFINGVVYVTDGNVKRVSNQIVIYVPENVDIDEIVAKAAVDIE